MKVKASIPRGGSDLSISKSDSFVWDGLAEVEMAVERKMGHRTR
jgi:hypothetical protein